MLEGEAQDTLTMLLMETAMMIRGWILGDDLGDEVIDPHETIAAVENRLPLIAFSGGSHRFDHMKALLPTIQSKFFTTRDREEMKIQHRP